NAAKDDDPKCWPVTSRGGRTGGRAGRGSGRTGGHFAKDYRVVPRNVNPVNARNPTARACYECGSTDHIKGNMS
nr:hypothetical protein [Tanacetum cinerariifolium]